MSCEIRNTTRTELPRIPFKKIAAELLGSRFDLSLVLCGEKLARNMNSTYRKKKYSPNVLSFPLGKQEGEIFLNVPVAAHEARRYKVSLRARLTLLFAHGCLHLKGVRHGVAMERRESTIVRKYSS